jgi:hypothetical protein
MKRYLIAILGLRNAKAPMRRGRREKSPGGPDAAGAKRNEEASGGEAPPSKRLERSRAATPLEDVLDRIDRSEVVQRRSPPMARIAVAGALAVGALGLLAGTLTWATSCAFPGFGHALLLAVAVGTLAGAALVVWAGRDSGAGAILAGVVVGVAVAFLALIALIVAVGASCLD